MYNVPNNASSPPWFLCEAHRHNVRVVLLADFPVAELLNATAQADFVDRQLSVVESLFMDGINLDFESQIDKSARVERAALSALARRTSQRFHARQLQVSFDVAWSPDCIDNRCYDYVALANSVDFLFGMFYDTRSQVFTNSSTCNAGPNTPLSAVVDGLAAFRRRGIGAERIVLGLPWYGYDYPCVNWTSRDAAPCTVASVPFRGARCSDAAGTQKSFFDINALVVARRNTTAVTRHGSDGVSFNYVDALGTVHQVWFDDDESLRDKLAVGKKHGVLGGGCWEVDEGAFWKSFRSVL